MGRRIWSKIVRILLILVAVMSVGAFMALRTRTMTNPWIVIIAALVPAALIASFCAAKATGIIPFRQFLSRLVAWIAIALPIVVGIFYGVNYAGRDKENVTTVSATVDRKYYDTRKRTRRVGRGRYAPIGETYNVYYADLRLDNGHIVTVPLTGNNISRVQTGQKLLVSVTNGAFGIPVIITDILERRVFSVPKGMWN